MTEEEAHILKGVEQILRLAERSASPSSDANQSVSSTDKSSTSKGKIFLNARIGNRVIGEVLSKAIFGIGVFFVAIFTGGIAALLPDRDGKVMFAGFAVVCLLVAVYHTDLTTRWIRTSLKNPGADKEAVIN